MSETYTGTVTGSRRIAKNIEDNTREISVALDRYTQRPLLGDRVTVTMILTDEEIGRRLREMLTEGISRRSVQSLADDIRDDVIGWPMLADLIESIIGEEDPA